jgi:hypothetical protein
MFIIRLLAQLNTISKNMKGLIDLLSIFQNIAKANNIKLEERRDLIIVTIEVLVQAQDVF